MPSKLGFVAVLLALACGGACSSSDYELERRGGPLPPGPVVDEPSDGGSAAGGNSASAGSGDGGDGGVSGVAVSFCDALTVIQAKCQRCHGDPLHNGAPVAFLDFDDLHAQYYDTELEWWQVAVGMVERDAMPYVALNDSPTLEGGTVEPLTTDEKATLLGWLQQGALPEGGIDCP